MRGVGGGKLIDTKWLDVSKGDSSPPNYRSRLVGREFNTFKDDRLYAATPPLEALRVVSSNAASHREGEQEGSREVMIADVSRAYFYAPVRRPLFIELPSEDPDRQEGEVGRLSVCLYGTRDAANGWQEELASHLVSIGYRQGKGHPAVFYHAEKDIMTLVHGDDYVSSGSRSAMVWLEEQLQHKYKIKVQKLHRPEAGGMMEAKVLNRIVRWTEGGCEVEADPRHAELIMEETLEKGMRSLSTPGSDEKESDKEGEELLVGDDIRRYRSAAARCNYLAQDRPEILYTVKEACREMATPTKSSWKKLQRVGQSLKGRPTLVWVYPWQSEVNTVDVLSDSNWAGCRRTRKSTSGGATLIGGHCTKAWSKTQSLVARSSGEAELYAVVRSSCEALGAQTLLADMGRAFLARVHVDASTATSICERAGLDKLRHIDVIILWVQEQQVRGKAPLHKIHGKVNAADLMTKNLTLGETEQHLGRLNVFFREGRTEKAAQLYELDGDKNCKTQGHATDAHGCAEVIGDEQNPGGGGHCKYPGDGKVGGSDGSVGNVSGTQMDRWISRGNNKTWVRQHEQWRSKMFNPIGAARGPRNADGTLWSLRITSGVTNSGQRFSITDDRRQARDDQDLAEQWTGTTTFYVNKHGRWANDMMKTTDKHDLRGRLREHVPETKASDGPNIPHQDDSVGEGDAMSEDFHVGSMVHVDGHGSARITGIGCCGHDGLYEVTFGDLTRFHVARRSLTRRHNVWADAEDSERDG